MALRAFGNNATLKATYLNRARGQRASDPLASVGSGGRYGSKGRVVLSRSKGPYRNDMEIPEILVNLESALFDGMSNADAMGWPVRFLTAINVGADLTGVWPRFALWLLSDPTHGAHAFVRGPRSTAASLAVIAQLQLQVGGATVPRPTWLAAAREAYAAAYALYSSDAAIADSIIADEQSAAATDAAASAAFVAYDSFDPTASGSAALHAVDAVTNAVAARFGGRHEATYARMSSQLVSIMGLFT